MSHLKKYRHSLTEFISSDKGQQFFNFAYSIGAAIVIWGALFKILHIQGGDTLLAIGMGTEVIMFVLTAFDKPYTYSAPAAPAADTTVSQSATPATASVVVPAPAAAPLSDTATMAAATEEYADHLATLSRNISALNAMYEIQLKSVSSQLDTIERANQGVKDMREMYEKCSAMSALYCEEAEKMARNMARINQVYANMIAAMTVNTTNHTDGIQQ